MSSPAATGHIDHHHDHTTSTGIPNKKLLMWAFLASDCMFFGALISTHLVYRLHPPPGNAIRHPGVQHRAHLLLDLHPAHVLAPDGPRRERHPEAAT
jgi:heme/copper-type cytochrome/quinol oxidase subunit 3